MVFTPSKKSLEFPPLLEILPEEERWAVPPFGWDHEAIDDNAFQPCRLHLRQGPDVDGDLCGFEPVAGQLRFRAAGTTTPSTVRFDQLRTVALTQPLVPMSHAGTLPTPEHERDFRVEIIDGTLLSGTTVGKVETQFGLFLFPPVDIDRSVLRLFVPRAAYRRAEFGPTALEKAAASWIHTPQDLLAAIERQPNAPVLPMGQALTNLGLATSRQIDRALAAQADNPDVPLGQILVKAGVVSPPDLEAALAHKMGIPLVDVERFPIDAQATRRLPLRAVMAMQALPLMLDGNRLILAVSSPSKVSGLRALKVMTQLEPVAVLARRAAIDRVLATMTAQDVWAPIVPPETPPAG